jgi:hypothetical protein
MPYVGTGLVSNFASTFRDNFTGDGSTTSFTLSRNAHHENDLEVFVGNVRQQPGSAYTVSGTTLAFTGTPANGEVYMLSIKRVHYKLFKLLRIMGPEILI